MTSAAMGAQVLMFQKQNKYKQIPLSDAYAQQAKHGSRSEYDHTWADEHDEARRTSGRLGRYGRSNGSHAGADAWAGTESNWRPAEWTLAECQASA